MQRDEQDDTIMDLDPDKSLESQRPPQIKGGGDDGPPLNKDPVYEKYFRMLKMVNNQSSRVFLRLLALFI